VKYVVAQHSGQLPDGTYGGNPGGWVVTSTEGSFYHAGDTALTMDMQLLKRFALSFAFLPIGDNYTMGPDDAIEAAHMVGVKRVIGIHYNTFPQITIDTEKAKAAFSKAGLELLLPKIGSTIDSEPTQRSTPPAHGQDHHHREPERRRGQDHHRHQPRRLPGRARAPHPAGRRRSPGQRHQRHGLRSRAM
jgi:hypothetical protein